MPHRHSTPDRLPVLPDPSPELILIREFVTALPKKQRDKVIARTRAALIALMARDSVTLIRPPSSRPAVLKARAEAWGWFVGTFGAHE
jgi:hypothetical protein